MKKFVCLTSASVALVLLSACASNSAPPAAAATTAAAGTMYCYKDRLSNSGGNFGCNWSSSAREACSGFAQFSNISASATSGEPVDSKRCDSGKWLVQVTMK